MTELRNFPEPSPEMVARQPWRADPRWIAARNEWVSDDLPGETANARLARGMTSLMDMYRIEAEHEARTT